MPYMSFASYTKAMVALKMECKHSGRHMASMEARSTQSRARSTHSSHMGDSTRGRTDSGVPGVRHKRLQSQKYKHVPFRSNTYKLKIMAGFANMDSQPLMIETKQRAGMAKAVPLCQRKFYPLPNDGPEMKEERASQNTRASKAYT